MRIVRTWIAIVMALCLISANAKAEPAPVVAAVAQGQPSPLSGVVFSPAAVAKVIAERDQLVAVGTLRLEERAALDAAQERYHLDALASTHRSDLALDQAKIADYQRQVELLTKQLQASRSTSITPAWWIGIGAATGVALCIVVRLLVTSAAK